MIVVITLFAAIATRAGVPGLDDSNSRRVFDVNEAVETDQIKQISAIMVSQGLGDSFL